MIAKIWREVMLKYPRTEAERICAIERRMMDAVREHYKNKLINERKAETGILEEVRKDAKAT